MCYNKAVICDAGCSAGAIIAAIVSLLRPDIVDGQMLVSPFLRLSDDPLSEAEANEWQDCSACPFLIAEALLHSVPREDFPFLQDYGIPPLYLRYVHGDTRTSMETVRLYPMLLRQIVRRHTTMPHCFWEDVHVLSEKTFGHVPSSIYDGQLELEFLKRLVGERKRV